MSSKVKYPQSPQKQTSTKKMQEEEKISSPQSPMKKYFGEKPASRKKKKTQANKDIRKERFSYNQYVERRSILDPVYEDSLISQSPFRGLLKFLMIISVIYVLNHLTVSFEGFNLLVSFGDLR